PSHYSAPTESNTLSLHDALPICLDGIEQGLTPPEEVTDNIFAMDEAARAAHGIESLPGTLKEAIDAMEADALVCETLGGHVTAQDRKSTRLTPVTFRSRMPTSA